MFTGETVYDYSHEYIYIKKNITLIGEPGVARPVPVSYTHLKSFGGI